MVKERDDKMGSGWRGEKMKRKARATRFLILILSTIIFFVSWPDFFPSKHNVAKALDTDVVHFADIHMSAWSETKQVRPGYLGTATGWFSIDAPETIIKNIVYNKITKVVSYEITPVNYHFKRSMKRDGEYSSSNFTWNMQVDMRDDVDDGPVPWVHVFNWEFPGFATIANLGYSMTPVDFYMYETTDVYKNITEGAYDRFNQKVDNWNYWESPSGVLPNIPTKLKLRIVVSDDQNMGFYGSSWSENFSILKEMEYDLIPNNPPTLSLSTPDGQTLFNDEGRNTLNIEGFVQDPDNNDVTVSAEIPNVFYKKTTIAQAFSNNYFSIGLDTIQDSIPPGDYTIYVKAVDPMNAASSTATLTLRVRQRLKRNVFLLINTPVSDFRTTYSDIEGDAKYTERFRYDQDPNFFDNSMGSISDTGLWRNSPYDSFPLSGLYVASYQPRDTPKWDDRFDEFRMWARDSLTQVRFQVHRKPIALFTAKVVNGGLQLADSSYDLDHTSRTDKGIIDWQWQYRKGEEEIWTDGTPSGALSTSENYTIRLRVRDIDDENNLGVWSDWCVRTVGSASGNLAPVAMFTVTPNQVSYPKATTIEDKSFDPDNDPLDIYEWKVVKDGWQQVWYTYGGAGAPPSMTNFGVGSYQITLKVHDNRGLWSEPFSQYVTVMNHPPAPDFQMPTEVYRDTIINIENKTPDPDEDGDGLSYAWNTRVDGSGYYYSGNSRDQTIKVQNLIDWYGISPKKTISDGWEMRLTASDGSLSANATQTFVVKNHAPTAVISGADTVFVNDTLTYVANDADDDPSDVSSLRYYWRVTAADGSIKMYNTANINVSFAQTGVYTLEHWVVDQVDDKSNVATLIVNVKENLPPSMTLTAPAGTTDNPSIIDAEKEGDPVIQWDYADPENDAQEKYRLDFFTKDGLLAKSVENTDSTGSTRQLKMPDQSFERFLFYSVQGRAFSKNNWSDISNERAFIIDNPPVPGFSLVTDTGKDAILTPIYRTDILQITSTAHDDDQPKGDSLTYKYYLKPSSGAEGLISSSDSFTKQFTTNDTFTIRQVVTDSLGLWREVSHAFIVKNRLPVVNLTFPTSDTAAKPTIASTMTPIMKWSYTDDDGDEQQRYRVRILDAATGSIVVQSGEQASSLKQWTVPAGALVENHKYAVEVEVFDGFDWSTTSPRKYFMVNLLSVKGGVKHTAEWNANRQSYNLKISGDTEQPRGYNIFWAGEKFVLQADATGLPDTIDVTMDGGFTAQLSPSDSDKTFWTGELYDPSFEHLPNGPLTFTFTAKNEYNTKIDKVTVTISENWSQYFRSHRIK